MKETKRQRKGEGDLKLTIKATSPFRKQKPNPENIKKAMSKNPYTPKILFMWDTIFFVFKWTLTKQTLDSSILCSLTFQKSKKTFLGIPKRNRDQHGQKE